MENNSRKSIFTKPWVQSLTGIIIISSIVAGVLFYKSYTASVSIENGTVSAPIIVIGPEASGILDEVYVKTGDSVTAGEPLAHVGSEVLYSKINGLVISVNNTPGQLFSPSQAVVRMIDPNELRIVGTIKEDAGFSKIKISNPATFTLDAFGGKKYVGIVDEVSETSKDTSVVFSISDKREVKDYTVKIKYDTSMYQFKNGMSSKIKIFYK